MSPSRRTAITFIGIFIFTITAINFLIVRIIPPKFGLVLDSVTGKPVAHVNVLLQVSAYEAGSVHMDVRHQASSNVVGLFVLPGTLEWNPLFRYRDSWVTVNEDAQGATGGEQASAATEILYDPLFNRGGWPVGNPKYFPVAVTFRPGGCARIWDAACLYKIFPFVAYVSLVPVLNGPDDCGRISRFSEGERCRQLNTYHAAIAHSDTYQDAQKSKELCNHLQFPGVSEACLDQLARYAANGSQSGEPIPDGMFPDTIGGLPVMENRHCGPKLAFSGRRMCAAGYGSESHELVAVYIEEWPGTEKTTEQPSWKPAYTDHLQARINAEIWPGGGNVLHYEGPIYNSYYWYSGDRRVEVFFYHPFPKQPEFVSYYMQHFPSSLPGN
jgi:hypothetical protein